MTDETEVVEVAALRDSVNAAKERRAHTPRIPNPCDVVKEDRNTHRCAAQQGHDFDLHMCACGHRWGDPRNINPQATQP